MSLSTIIVSWQSEGHIGRCLQSLIEYGPVDNQIIVVDNNSTDGTLKEIGKFNVKLVANPVNYGLGYATCQAEKLVKHDLILIANPDISFNANLRGLLEFAEDHPEFETFGPSLKPSEKGTYGKNPPRFHRFPFMFGFSIGQFLDHHLGRFLTKFYMSRPEARWRELKEAEDDHHIYGTSCMLLRRDAVRKMGGIYRARYFSTFADADMGMRAAKAHIRGTTYPEANFEHYGGYSTRQLSQVGAGYLSGLGQAQFEKDWGHWTRITVLWIIDTVFLALLLKLRMRSGPFTNRIAYLQGWFSIV